jgi:hypothetical protein
MQNAKGKFYYKRQVVTFIVKHVYLNAHPLFKELGKYTL